MKDDQKNLTINIPPALYSRRKVLEAEQKRLDSAMQQVNARMDEVVANALLLEGVKLQEHRVMGFSQDGSQIFLQKIENDGKEQKETKGRSKAGK